MGGVCSTQRGDSTDTVLVRKPDTARPHARPTRRWKDSIRPKVDIVKT
jgi:hypothetical protein